MKKTLLLITACLFIGKADAQDSDISQSEVFQKQEFEQLRPTYLDNVFFGNGWEYNWFLSARGGVSTFVGKPIGHGDFFDRQKEMLNVSLGKFFTPYIGGRIAFQGQQILDSKHKKQDYQNFHADFIYNVAAHFWKNCEDLPKWDVMPYAGLGFIRNADKNYKPFAISYGLIGRYRLTDRWHISAELGATTTWQDFDGIGSSKKLGDHLLQASIGLDWTIGKVGWKKAVDPWPYVFQNKVLMEYVSQLENENAKLSKMHNRDAMALREMHKILEIEGLLDKYNLVMSMDEETLRSQPRNNYSGLNSLRARLRNKGWNGNVNEYKPVLANKETLTDSTNAVQVDNSIEIEMTETENYFQVMKDGKIFVGAPIYFFFKKGTNELTEKAQLINVKEIAGVMKKFGLHARIVGAADSQTGTAYLNERLSERRANSIAKLIEEQGVSGDMIQTQYRGGISTYEPQEGNRNTCVMLYFK